MSGIETHFLLGKVDIQPTQVRNISLEYLIAEVNKGLSAFETHMRDQYKNLLLLNRSAVRFDPSQGALFYAYWSFAAASTFLTTGVSSSPLSVNLDHDELLLFQNTLKFELQALCSTLSGVNFDVNVSRLTEIMNLEGAAIHERPFNHYVVETDVENGWLDEVFRWYDVEHMPGLSRVPGCVRAKRYINHDTGPYSLACYDLVASGVLGCPEWLAVRETAWSDVARPHFINTRRTMFQIV